MNDVLILKIDAFLKKHTFCALILKLIVNCAYLFYLIFFAGHGASLPFVFGFLQLKKNSIIQKR